MNEKLVCAYVRLSKEDLNKSSKYSVSIYNQIALIKSYAKSLGLTIDKEYIDDGFSGINFERPAFEKLRQDIEKGIVGIVITKDISRLGRNFLETAYYVSEYFVKNDVRYIAINDQYDSLDSNNELQDMMFSIQSIINDKYVKDSSVKRKQVAEAKTENKEFIGFMAPYGYKIVKHDNKRTLEIDSYAAGIVKRIFTEIASGKSRKEVADILNKEKIKPPVIYLKMTQSRGKNYYYDWTDKIVYRILKNKTYTGRIVYRKSTKEDYHEKIRNVIPIRDRQVIDNCHPVIISDKLFNEANSRLRTSKRREKNNYNGLFSNLVVCGECGRTMTACRVRKENGNIKYHFECTNFIYRKQCSNRTIADSKLKAIVKDSIKDIIDNYVSGDDVVSNECKILIEQEKPNLKINNLKSNLDLIDNNIRNLYLQKSKGEITLEQFLERKKKQNLLKEDLENQLQQVIESKNEILRKEELLSKYTVFIEETEFMNNALRDFVKQIVVYKDNTLKLEFKFGLGNPVKIKLF